MVKFKKKKKTRRPGPSKGRSKSRNFQGLKKRDKNFRNFIKHPQKAPKFSFIIF